MIIIVLLFVYLAILAVAMFLTIRHTLHMFQLNSYQYQAHFRFLRTHKVQFLFPFVGVLLANPLVIRLFVTRLGLVGGFLFGGMEIVYAVIMCIIYRPKKAKIKLVMTARVKRLLATALVFIVPMVLIMVHYSLNKYWWLFGVCVWAIVLAPYAVLLANICNRPIEKGINRWYINDARKMLKSCPDLKIIGITGSYGKTSVKYYLNTLLGAGFDVLMTPESYNTPMGIVKTIRTSLKATNEIFLCEMGARHVGDIKEDCDIVDPQIGIITSIGNQHFETFKSQENIVKTKLELFDALPEGAPRFINGDNAIIREYDMHKGAITYGLAEDNAYRAFDLEYSEKGAKFKVKAPDGCVCEYQTELLGEHSVINITGAIAVAHELGIPMEKLRIPVRRLEGAPHRLQMVAKGGNLTIIDDSYNSNPNGANMALCTLGGFKGVRILVTPGMVELGAQEYDCNFELGASATKYCDYIIPVGKTQTKPIQDGVASTGFDMSKMYVAETLQDAMSFVQGIVTDQMKYVLLENDLPDNY